MQRRKGIVMKKMYESPLVEEFAVLSESIMNDSSESGITVFAENDNEVTIASLFGL